jgi:tRNA pseudouridine38-40 synthase
LFFNHIDHFQNESFLYVTAGGIPASQPTKESSDGATPAGGNKIERDALAAVESDIDGDDKLDDGEEGG